MEFRKVLFVHDGPLYCNREKTEFFGLHYNNDLVDRYVSFGHEVSFLMRLETINNAGSNRYSEITHPDFSFIEIPNFKSFKTYHKKQSALGIIRQAVDAHDVIVARLPSAAGALAFEYAVEINKPVLVEMVACVYDALWNYDYRGKLLAYYKLYQYRKHLQKATHVVYVTNYFLQKRYPTKGKSIGCSDVVIEKLEDSVLTNRLAKIDNNKCQLVLGTVAAIDVPYKGQDDVIKAVSILRKMALDIKYVIVGQGDPAFLKTVIKEHQVDNMVEIRGPLPSAEVFHFLDDIDIYIQPSKTEGLPRALIEAMSRACPSLGARVGGIPELLDDNCLFEPGNVSQIVKMLKQVDSAWMQKQVRITFDDAKKYQKDNLEEIRRDFYHTFLIDHSLD